MSDAEQALVRAYVGCRLALESLDDLPQETAEAVGEPLREFCRRLDPFVAPFLERSEATGSGS